MKYIINKDHSLYINMPSIQFLFFLYKTQYQNITTCTNVGFI